MKRSIVTVTLDADYQLVFGELDGKHQFSSSRSIDIREIKDAGQPSEARVSPEEEHGFLWRMNSYWRYEQTEGGVIVYCESVSLSRDIPRGLGWLIGPVTSRMPRESLRSTLEATREAVGNASQISQTEKSK